MLEAVVYSQDHQQLTSYNRCKGEYNLYNFGGSTWSYDFGNYASKLEDDKPFVSVFDANSNYDASPNSDIIQNNGNQLWDNNQDQQHYVNSNNYLSSSPEQYFSGEAPPRMVDPPMECGGDGRRKRRRRSCKNKEEVEQQRMTHIAVERNRRKQMNEYLAVIRSLMPPSYAQRGDQASIVGGAINYVKELEQLLQSLEAQKRTTKLHHQEQQRQQPSPAEDTSVDDVTTDSRPPAFAEFFSFPQYSSRSPTNQLAVGGAGNSSVSSNSGAGEIEVTMVESHANVKILAKKQAKKQLLRLVAGFQGLRFSVLHLNVTTVDSLVLYSFSLKVEEGCQLNSVDDIAAAANHILVQSQDESDGLI